MTDAALLTEPSPVTPFDPADWLTRFRAVGGWWTIGRNGTASVGWMIEGFTDAQNDEARAIWREVERNTGKRDAIRAHLTANAEGATEQPGTDAAHASRGAHPSPL